MAADKLDIILTNDEAEVRRRVAEGYCPVECSMNGRSIVDALQMDHHEDLSHLEAVSVRAIRDLAGARAADPRFVTVGACDADAAFAIAALAGLIPKTPETLALGETIAVMDTDPVGRQILAMPYGDFYALWDKEHEGPRTNRTPEGAIAAVRGWQEMAGALSAPGEGLKQRLAGAREAEERRIEIAERDLQRATTENGVCLIPGSQVFGFDVWYGRNESAPKETAAGWKNSIVVIYNATSKTAAVACPNRGVAEELFGPGGLKNVFAALPGGSWGGRESVGGSPRGKPMTLGDAEEAQHRIAALLAARRAGLKPQS